MITKETLTFLDLLKENNNREWFQDHKNEYQEALNTTKVVFTKIYQDLANHDQLDKMKVFRIYRDVRFSKDKTPYKTHFGLHLQRATEKLRGGYYLHIAPNNESFVGGGFYAPNSQDLLRIRKEIEQDGEELKTILSEQKFKSFYPELLGDSLKTAPKGFDKNHPEIELLRKKQFYVLHQLTDEEIQSDHLYKKVEEAFTTLRPFFDYMSNVLTTDLNGVSIFDED